MVQPAFGGALDTPRTNIGDATYLSHKPDFADISQEASFQSPGKDNNLLQQLRNGRRGGGINLRTPRRGGPLADRINLPPSVGGAEFTPLLKSATRNSVRRRDKENRNSLSNTPGLDRVNEDDMTLLPRGETSIYTGSRNQSYLDNTLPQVDTSSAASTPLALPARRGGDKGPLQDGNQLSLREQENVIDRIEKENFGLKLKIHFLEEALRKAGPGFSEAALKENTELKVDKVTMQRELHKYKKHLTTAEKDLETYRQQMLELQEKAKRKYADESQRAELEKLRQTLEEKESDVEELQRQVDEGRRDQDQVDKLQDDIGDLEADLREKDRQITEREDELENLKDKLEEAEETAKDAKRKMIEMEEAERENEELGEAKDTIQSLELDIRRLEEQLDEMKENMDDAVAQKDRAEGDLEELQEEMANKSVVTKGLSRQIEEKVARLQEELDKSGENYAILEKELAEVSQENDELRSTVKELEDERDGQDGETNSLSARLRELENQLLEQNEEKDTLQSRYDALEARSGSLEKSVDTLQNELQDMEHNLSEERQHALEIERDLRDQYRGEIERLNDEISDLQAEIRERDNLYDNDSEKWETERQTLEAERERAEERAAGLQRTIDALREAEGSLTDKESKLQAAIASETERHRSEEGVLTRQVEDLQDALETRQTLLTNIRNELSTVRDELRQTQIDYQTQADKVAALEDEVDVLQAQAGDGSSRRELEVARQECVNLKEQVTQLRQAAESSRRSVSPRKSDQDMEEMAKLRRQLSETTAQLQKATREKQSLQDQVNSINTELNTLRSSLAEVEAEREELNGQLERAKTSDTDTLQLDRERLDLRTAKMKLDNEVRRLKDENSALTEQRASVEKALDDEIEKAAAEEDRLGQEILQLQSRLRQSSTSETGDLASARRTIRDLERRIDDYQDQLAANEQLGGNIEGSSELSMVRKDLSAARQKELEYIQRESGHRDVVKGLKRQITDLERQVHNEEMSRLIASPASTSSDSARRRTEVTGLRQQLTSAQQSISELKSKSREADRAAAEATKDLQQQLDDLEDQKIVLEEVLEEARQQAEETAAQHERAMRHMKRKLDKLELERAKLGAPAASSDRNLRKSQAEIENLEHDVCQQQQTIDALVSSEGSLRRKLERARSERAAYRMTAEKLQRDIRSARKSIVPDLSQPQQSQRQRGLVDNTPSRDDEAIDTVVRAAQGAEERHQKELRGMVMQMEWMQARWEREASLRSDAAFAKKFLQLQLDIANAW